MYKAGKNLALDRLRKRRSAQKYNLRAGDIQQDITEAEMTRNETVGRPLL